MNIQPTNANIHQFAYDISWYIVSNQWMKLNEIMIEKIVNKPMAHIIEWLWNDTLVWSFNFSFLFVDKITKNIVNIHNKNTYQIFPDRAEKLFQVIFWELSVTQVWNKEINKIIFHIKIIFAEIGKYTHWNCKIFNNFINNNFDLLSFPRAL